MPITTQKRPFPAAPSVNHTREATRIADSILIRMKLTEDQEQLMRGGLSHTAKALQSMAATPCAAVSVEANGLAATAAALMCHYLATGDKQSLRRLRSLIDVEEKR